MATQADIDAALAQIQPFIDPTALQALISTPSYGNPNIPTSNPNAGGGGGGGNQFSIQNNPDFMAAQKLAPIAGKTVGKIDPVVGMISGLFGGGGGNNQFQPYVNAQGQLVWSNPAARNPVPVPQTPGTTIKPSKVYQREAQAIQAYTDLMPYMNQASLSQLLPTAQAQFQASQATSPEYAQLMTQLYNQYGPQLNAIGNEISRRNMLAQAQNLQGTVSGPGQGLVASANQLQQQTDPQYYAARAQAGGALSNLINSIDLSGALSPNERNEIAKGLALQNARGGTANAPSQTQTVANAMTYGQKAYERQQQAKSNLSQAISNASAFMPASKSGIDAFNIATGGALQSNPGNSLFPGVNQNQGAIGQSSALSNQLFGGIQNITGNQMTIDANRKDWLDKFNQLVSGIGGITKSIGNLGGIAGGLMGG